MQYQLILASTSKYRKSLLEKLNYKFESKSPPFDEAPLKERWKEKILHLQQDTAITESVFDLVMALAASKAKSIVPTPNSIIVGSDQIVYFDKVIYSKPGNLETALKAIQSLTGKTHLIITAVCVAFYNQDLVLTEKSFLNIAKMTMRKLTTEEIENYLKLDQPFDCAGAYKLEQNGISLFEKIDCDDWTGIQGLPLLQLGKELRSYEIEKT